MTADELMAAQRLVRRIPVGESVVEAILKLVRAGRPDDERHRRGEAAVAWGPGPRASQALMLACRARALLEGRLAPSVDDVRGAGRAGAAPSHGAQLRGARRRRHHGAGHRSAGRRRSR